MNAWSSLAYSIFGGVTLLTGIQDFLNLLDSEKEDFEGLNRYAQHPSFSIFFGLSLSYLGVASFLFHASHSEPWRKADAGMTSGVLFPLLFFALWDRVRPPAMSSVIFMALSVLMVFSMTHGYVPYGSSDVLAPAIPLTFMYLEYLPRYGGVVSVSQYTSWYECFYIGLAAALLRAYDIKRNSPGTLYLIPYTLCRTSGKQFVDLEFPPVETSLYSTSTQSTTTTDGTTDGTTKPSTDEGSASIAAVHKLKVQWRRPQQFMKTNSGGVGNTHTVIDGVIEPDDIRQGALGNCWFLCALAAMAEYPPLVTALFPSTEQVYWSV